MPLAFRLTSLALFAAWTAFLAIAVHAADPKDEKKDAIYYTVEKTKPGILKVVVHDTPLGDKDLTIDTNPKNSAGIKNERPVVVEVESKEVGKEFSLSVKMAKGGLTVESVSWNGKKVPLIDPKKKAAADKKAAEKKVEPAKDK